MVICLIFLLPKFPSIHYFDFHFIQQGISIIITALSIALIFSYAVELDGCHSYPHLMCYHVGHVDAGKSTLMGHLLYKLGHVSKKTMYK